MKTSFPLWGLLLLSAAGLFFSGCSGGSDNGPVISALLTRQAADGSFPLFSASVTVQSQGQPVTNAAVTLVSPVPSATPVPLRPVGNGIYEDIDTGDFSYLPGGVYVFQVGIGGTVYSASATAPGGISIPNHVSGMPVSWEFPGNVNVAKIHKADSDEVHQFLTNLTSPWSPPAEDLADPSIYEVEVSCTRNVLGAFDGGAGDSSFVKIEDENSQPVTNP